eukprot:TRINITY_DN20900_c1_g1_i1.p1 TRINITY_DN20900_c1_g1~~TRINITY_DN20900_c1_g1_i1.p1  ORF type:complete len:161 (-),score=11.94 TRINITY_DN20900_c1_g1_i1:265-747(-)
MPLRSRVLFFMFLDWLMVRKHLPWDTFMRLWIWLKKLLQVLLVERKKGMIISLKSLAEGGMFKCIVLCMQLGIIYNPELFYLNPNVEQDHEVMSGLYNCFAKLVSKNDVQDKYGQELSIYMKAEGLFGIPMAIKGRTIKSPSKLPLYYKISFLKLLVNTW